MKHLFLALLLAGCGDKGFQFSAGQLEDKVDEAISAVSHLKGSAQYAFNLSVDGQEFTDIEDYYTQQVDLLQSKVLEAGYDVDRVEFAGKLGFSDFIKDMSVFVVSSANTQGKGVVDSQGNFSISVPNPNQLPLVTFKVRAQKRVQLILIKNEMVSKKLCYNFSAVDMDVIENPILLSNFKTDLTMYDCSQDKPSGMNVPSVSIPDAKSFTLNMESTVSAMWVKENQFLVDSNGQRQLYVLNGLVVTPVGSPEAAVDAPAGFILVGRSFNLTEMQSRMELGSDVLTVVDRINYSEVSLLRSGRLDRAFLVDSFGINLLARDGARIMAVGRVISSNHWRVGYLDLINNKFIARADGLNGLWVNAATTVVNGTFTMVAGSQILFVAM